jgi:hypothetical protein
VGLKPARRLKSQQYKNASLQQAGVRSQKLGVNGQGDARLN